MAGMALALCRSRKTSKCIYVECNFTVANQALRLQLALAQHLAQCCDGLAYGLLTLLQASRKAINLIHLPEKRCLVQMRRSLL